MTIPTVALRSGAELPMLGFGTWQLPGEQATAPVREALEAGYRHIDTATMYRNEAQVGRALRESGVPREEVFLTTKLLPQRAAHARGEIEQSLRELAVDVVDLWLIHAPPGGASPATWEALLAARDDGLVRDVGVSNYSPAEVDELVALEAPAVNQIRWSPWAFDAERLRHSRGRGVILEGYSPFRASRLDDPVLRQVADAHGVTPAQVVLRWHLESGVVVIPKSATPERIRANLDVTGFTLTEQERTRLDGLAGS